MKIDCVLTATTLDLTYLSFVPLFIKAWKLVDNNIDIKIIILSDEIPEHLYEYSKYILLYRPDKSISFKFVSQYIRLLYPAILNYENGILITDMDMLPLNSKYYMDPIKDIDDDNFVIYRGNVQPRGNQYTMCYNVAKNTTWSEIFKINSISDIDKRLKEVYTECNYANHTHMLNGSSKFGWEKDQTDLFSYVNNWSKRIGKVSFLTDPTCKYCRLDRGSFVDENKVINNNTRQTCIKKQYSDYHACRPNTEWRKKVNEELVNLAFSTENVSS